MQKAFGLTGENMETYRGVRITSTYFSGHKNVVYDTIQRSVTQICREGRGVGAFYIGIASGPDYYFALSRRIDAKKMDRGVTDMYLLYQSSSERNTCDLERWLIDHFREIKPDDRLWNSAIGGGGRPGSGPYFFLYLATTFDPD